MNYFNTMRRLLKSLAAVLFIALPFSSCKEDKPVVEIRTPENRVIYEIFVRNFSPEGTFKGVEKHVPRLKDLGVDVIWLMPIYELGEEGKWGTYSSPYAIKNYKEIDPMYGSADDLHDLINAIHEAGMEVWFDWVGNHTSMDAEWVTSHPEYYQHENGEFVHPHGWGDVYQLDVDNHEMHEAMIDAMQYWVDEFDIDGYRCDYASGPSQEFWEEATSQVLKNGNKIAWLAEDDAEPELVTNGWFDYNWTWKYFGAMDRLKRGRGTIDDLRKASADLHTDERYKGKSRIMYTSSHDVVQDNGRGEDVGYRVFGDFQKPFTVLQFTVYGTPVIYSGQEINYQDGKQILSEKYTIDWENGDKATEEFYKDLIRLKHTHPSLRTGEDSASYTNLNTSAQDNIMAYMRGEGEKAIVVLLNLSGENVDNFNVEGLPSDSGKFTELFTGNKTDFTSGNSFSLPAYGYAVYYNDKALYRDNN